MMSNRCGDIVTAATQGDELQRCVFAVRLGAKYVLEQCGNRFDARAPLAMFDCAAAPYFVSEAV